MVVLRVLNIVSQETCLVKVHESEIIDMKFSSEDSSIFCTVSADLTAIWKLLNHSTLACESLLRLPFGADVVEPHPCIAGGNNGYD